LFVLDGMAFGGTIYLLDHNSGRGGGR